MKIEDGIIISRLCVEIPSCSRNHLPQFFADNGYLVGAEIGVYKGEYTKLLLDAGLTIFAVDPFLAYDDYNEPKRDFQARQDYLYAKLVKKPRQYPKCTIVRKTSMEAIKDFKKGSLDFVYIDGHHGFKYVAEDLWEWSKIVRKGGIISGHDYALNARDARDPYVLHVKYVIDAYIKALEIAPLYILGRYKAPEGEIRDKFRSWMFINP